MAIPIQSLFVFLKLVFNINSTNQSPTYSENRSFKQNDSQMYNFMVIAILHVVYYWQVQIFLVIQVLCCEKGAHKI